MKSKFLPRNKTNIYGLQSSEKKYIEEAFPFFNCSIDRSSLLTCKGWLQPDGCKSRYHVKIESMPGKEPKTTILSPSILPSVHIHMYSDHSLCLHYKPDLKWTERIFVWKYTIPWLCEWIIFYELYEVNGQKWLGRESPFHLSEEEFNLLS